jgi:hypothetical protein
VSLFLQRFSPDVIGVLSGFDRLRFRGTLRLLNTPGGFHHFLWQKQVLLKDFKPYALGCTARLKQAVEAAARDAGRPLIFLNQGERKEDLARQIAAADGVRHGLIAVFSAVETCRYCAACPDKASKRLQPRVKPGKCLHYYHYFNHPELGLMHVRTQTWFPFNVHLCLNGREWLARALDRAGIGYVKKDNCFVDLQDVAAAQALMDSQLSTDWPALLSGLAACANPALASILEGCVVPYYWSAEETEWATDLMFRSPLALARLYPALVRHGMLVLGSADVMRYLGHKLKADGGINGNFKGEVVTDLKGRPEGVRVKHRAGANWVKMYDKQGSVLRVETVINDTRQLKSYRAPEKGEGGGAKWLRMRKGVADLHRRAEVSQKANERYAEALAQVEQRVPLRELAGPLSEPAQWHGRRARGLNVLGAEDARLLEAASRGEFLIGGLRNRDLRGLLYGEAAGKKGSAAVTRKVRLLRAHGLVSKVPSTHRYLLTDKGRQACAAILHARQADTAALLAMSA